jgi:hypothetical protein
MIQTADTLTVLSGECTQESCAIERNIENVNSEIGIRSFDNLLYCNVVTSLPPTS